MLLKGSFCVVSIFRPLAWPYVNMAVQLRHFHICDKYLNLGCWPISLFKNISNSNEGIDNLNTLIAPLSDSPISYIKYLTMHKVHMHASGIRQLLYGGDYPPVHTHKPYTNLHLSYSYINKNGFNLMYANVYYTRFNSTAKLSIHCKCKHLFCIQYKHIFFFLILISFFQKYKRRLHFKCKLFSIYLFFIYMYMFKVPRNLF